MISGPAGDDAHLTTATPQTVLSALNASTGKIHWQRAIAGTATNKPGVTFGQDRDRRPATGGCGMNAIERSNRNGADRVPRRGPPRHVIVSAPVSLPSTALLAVTGSTGNSTDRHVVPNGAISAAGFA